MGTKWTDEQKKVLETRNKNILVSAAAGSGKTAVLVERIIRLVTEENVDIDRLVVVTFTEAAAGEMRERILAALEKRARLEPDNDHIGKQTAYIHNASITTIHSFCLDIIRQYFNEIDIDPSFTVGDEGELTLIREDVMKELLEDKYREADEDFTEFVADYAGSGGKKDHQIEEFITELYKFAMSHPYPERWLEKNIENYNVEEGIENHPWYRFIKEETDLMLSYILGQMEETVKLSQSEDGPFTYEEGLKADYELVRQIAEAENYDRRAELLGKIKLNPLSRKKLPETADERKKERIKSIREDIKKDLKTLKEKYYAYTMNTVISDMEKCGRQIAVLVNLTKEFMERYSEAKLEKNIIDFNDMEHMALKILTVEDENGNIIPTQVARDISEDIYEIMIDEYQDSNLVQETVLKSVSSVWNNRNNIFMVGDVKQSIYKFRMAKPELFLDKYNTYSADDKSDSVRITLSKNFRSRKQVLDGTNLFFSQIMSENLGGIEYDAENALYVGAEYEDYGSDSSVELLWMDTSEFKNDDVTSRELEAHMAAKKIKAMIDGGYRIRDKATGKERPVRYSDIAILLRSFGVFGQIYSDTLAAYGIPVKSPAGTGYFDTFEVVQILNMLSVIDNPRQDIPFIGVMKHMFSFSDEELAIIKTQGDGDEECFCQCVEKSSEKGNKKAADFLSILSEYREKSSYMSIRDMIEDILVRTGFEYFVSSMKAGELRLANIEMLKVKAADFENNGNSGLFHFVRYVEKLKQYKVEHGEADMSGGGNYVTLMTIHKSKGLEFPVVIVGAMGKKFNKTDVNSSIVMHQELGVGIRYMDRAASVKADTMIRESIGRKIEKEGIAEELRIFYVAATRAGEKLILAGNGDIYGKIKKYLHLRDYKETKLPSETVFRAADYMDWVIMSVIRHKSFAEVLKGMQENVPFNSPVFEEPSEISINIMKPEDVINDRVADVIRQEGDKQSYIHWNADHIYDEETKDTVKSLYEYRYPYEEDLNLSGKVSVSDIKHMFMKMYDEETKKTSQEINGFETEDKPMLRFLEGEEKISGTVRGTAYHRIFELIDYMNFENITEKDDISRETERQLNDLKERKLAPDSYFEAVNTEKIIALIMSETGVRMRKAAAEGKLFREQQFVMGIPANMIKPEYSERERVLVQGVIDAYFEEDGQLVIVDYKTDNVADIKDLFARYEAQLNYYGKALEQITGKKVKEKILYSVKFCDGYVFR